MKKTFLLPFAIVVVLAACKKNSPTPNPPPVVAKALAIQSVSVGGQSLSPTAVFKGVRPGTNITVAFNQKLDKATVGEIKLTEGSANAQAATVNFLNDSLVTINSASLKYLTKYQVNISTGLKGVSGGGLPQVQTYSFNTGIDSSFKFPQLTDDALLNLVQRQTFKFFWDFGHPVSGLARERNSSGDVCTTGGTGFGVMSMVAAADRSFITRQEATERIQKIVTFYRDKVTSYHGAFAHWINGSTGATVPFSSKDNGADLVETSYLVQGLICAREYFTGGGAEATLRNDINALINKVEWDWFRKNNENQLYWHWSPTYNWEMNLPIRGWNESLITYILGAASTTHPIDKPTYTNGWASNGSAAFVNGKSFYGIPLPLGPDYGGPLFFAHYSFLGTNPNSLQDVYANYLVQNVNHTKINYNYCVQNPLNYFGYSNAVWGLTASDIPGGYAASSPTNDRGVIAPTAAIASLPYTPTESLRALKFYYYVLGDKLWKDYGFIDAFSLDELWFADSFLAIDQGPIIVMIENHRSGLLWRLFTQAPEVKAGLRKLGFSATYL